MKFVPVQLAYFLRNREAQRNIKLLMRFVAALVALVAVYTVLFHVIMESKWENQEHSWLSGLYWVLVVMSTLGFGDITFQSDIGRLFSVLVLVSGVVALLVVLPFAFIQFFLSPWLEAQSQARAPRRLPANIRDHVIVTSFDAVSENLMRRLKQFDIPYVCILQDLNRALVLHDLGFRVMVGDLDDPDTYRHSRAERAALIVATGGDMQNTSIAFTMREVSENLPMIANADSKDSLDILELAGATHVFEMKNMLGRFLARRVIGMSSRVNVIGKVDDLLIAEASATRTPLVGKTIAESRLREITGVTVTGIWERGKFILAQANSVVHPESVLVLAGTQEQMDAYDELFCIYVVNDAPVVILGGGRVGLAAAGALEEREIDYRIVESNPVLAITEKHVTGNAADLVTLKKARLHEAMTVLITTSDDETNVYLTVYCRKLYPELQIISRANSERNVVTLHRAGADFVMSYASMGSSIILNVLRQEDLVMFAEGLSIMRVKVPESAASLTVLESRIREETGSNVIAIIRDNKTSVNPAPDTVIQPNDMVVLAGNPEAETQVARLLGEKVPNRNA